MNPYAKHNINNLRRAYAGSNGTHADHVDAFTNYVEARMEIQEMMEQQMIEAEIRKQLSGTKARVEVEKASLQSVKKALADLFSSLGFK